MKESLLLKQLKRENIDVHIIEIVLLGNRFM